MGGALVLCDVWLWAMGCVCAEVLWRGAVKVLEDACEVQARYRRDSGVMQ